MGARCLLAATLFALQPNVLAAVKYVEKPDDFSNETLRAVIVTSVNGRAAISLSCVPEKLTVQFNTLDVIFPDDASGDHMKVSVTHKFDNAPEARTTNWAMPLMKYKRAWYQGDSAAFLGEALRAAKLALRLNRNATIYRFGFDEATEHLKRMVKGCWP